MTTRPIHLGLIVSLTLFLAAPILAGPEKVGPLLRAYTHPEVPGLFNYPEYRRKVQNLPSVAESLGLRVLIHGNESREELEALGVTVNTQAGNVFSAHVPPQALRAVSDLPGMFRINAARMLEHDLDEAIPEVDMDNVWGAVTPPYPGVAGAGVVVGDVDSGFDYTHDDFRTSGGLSRFHAIWDQTTATTWEQASLDNQTATTNDPDGHGTHVMGIAGGNGRGTGNGYAQYRYTGTSPEATLIGVKTIFSDAAILDGVSFIFARAATLGLPAVVNLSLGSQYGPHDGTDPFDVALDALVGPGKIVVASAGNARGTRIHARGMIPTTGMPSTLETVYQVDAYSGFPGSSNDVVLFDGYYESTDNYTVTVISPNGFTAGPVSRGVFTQTNTNDGAIQIDNGTLTNSTGDFEVFIAFFDQFASQRPAAGNWTIRYTRVTSTNSYIDLWNYANSGNIPGRFTTNWTDDVTVGSPGSASKVITVAAYTTNTSWASTNGNNYTWGSCPCIFGEIAPFSSRGPNRDGGQKPDIAAPGFGVFSTLSDDVPVTGGIIPLIDPDDVHWILTGTSMCAPMVTGVAALILSQNPGFDETDVKARLNAFAKTDVHTGAVWNADFGNGKLYGRSADGTPPSITISAPNGGETFIEGSMVNITWSASDNFLGLPGVSGVDLCYSTDGGSNWMSIATGLLNLGTYTWTVPNTPTTTALVRADAHDPVGNVGQDVSDAVFTIDSSIGVGDLPLPTRLILDQSRPNPSAGGAGVEIAFGITQEGPVRLRVFDTQGRLVLVLAEETRPAGFHAVQWNGKDQGGRTVGAGVYFYRLDTQEGAITRKMMILP